MLFSAIHRKDSNMTSSGMQRLITEQAAEQEASEDLILIQQILGISSEIYSVICSAAAVHAVQTVTDR